MGNKKIGRSAVTGRFVPVKTAQSYSATHIVQTMKRTPAKPTSKKTKS